MKISSFSGGIAKTNGYLVETPDGNLLIDAPEDIADWISSMGVLVDDVLITHQHYDHVLDAAALQKTGARIHAYAPFSSDLTLEKAARAMGMPLQLEPFHTDILLGIDSPLHLAGLTITLAHVPGHATDSVTFYLEAHNVVFSGDTLFAGSIGRTDLPGGNTRQLLDGIRRHLLTLPPDTRVFSGHGSPTTITEEIRSNPFLR